MDEESGDVYRGLMNSEIARRRIFTNMQLSVDGKTALIKGSDFRMTKWFDFPHTDSDHDSQKQFDNVAKLIDQMTPEQREKLKREMLGQNGSKAR